MPPQLALQGSFWAVLEDESCSSKEAFCRQNFMQCVKIAKQQLQGYPAPNGSGNRSLSTRAKKVLVTGCFDWLHSGHVRFFEEAAEFGDLFVIVGHDENVKLLKGEQHPMHSQGERCYMVGSIRCVKAASISSGDGWLDAEPEILQLRPDFYIVNEDGDRPEKSEYCSSYGIDYRVLKRVLRKQVCLPGKALICVAISL